MYKSHGSGWSGLDGISFAESGVDACVEVPKCMKLKLSSRVLYISCTSGCQSRGKWERSDTTTAIPSPRHGCGPVYEEKGCQGIGDQITHRRELSGASRRLVHQPGRARLILRRFAAKQMIAWAGLTGDTRPTQEAYMRCAISSMGAQPHDALYGC